MNKIVIRLLPLTTFIVLGYLHTSGQLTRGRYPLPTSFYSTAHAAFDFWNPGTQTTTKATIAGHLDASVNTLSFDADLSPEDIVEALKNPNNLVVKGNKTYVKVDGAVTAYLTTLELGPHHLTPEQLQVARDYFQSKCLVQGIYPDVYTVQSQGKQKTVIAFTINAQGLRVEVGRLNIGTGKIERPSKYELFCILLNNVAYALPGS